MNRCTDSLIGGGGDSYCNDMMSDLAEFVGYFVFFWAFIFSPSFREQRVGEWKSTGWTNRFFMLLEVLSSFFCGVVLPVMFLWWLVSK